MIRRIFDRARAFGIVHIEQALERRRDISWLPQFYHRVAVIQHEPARIEAVVRRGGDRFRTPRLLAGQIESVVGV